MADSEYWECVHCGRAQRRFTSGKETWLTISVFEEDWAGGRMLANGVVVCGRKTCWTQTVRSIRDGQFRERD